MSPLRRVAASSSACRLPRNPATYTSSTRSAGVTCAPVYASTVASAAGPHWYSVCGKNGTSASSAGAGPGGSVSPFPAQPPSSSAASSRLDLLEDINDADELENQQDDEHDADDAEQIAARRQVLEVVRERLQLLVRHRGDALVRGLRIDAELLELAAHFLAREHGIDAGDGRIAVDGRDVL